MKPTPDLDQALAFLPHGPEFRSVDRLVSLDPGREGVSEYRVRGDECAFGVPAPDGALPGVLLIEAAAQLAGVVAQSDPATPRLSELKLTALRSVSIQGRALPGDLVRVEVRIAGRLGGLIQAQAQAAVAGRPVLLAELTLGGTQPLTDSLTH